MPTKKESYDIDSLLDAAEPITPVPIEQRVMNTAERPYLSTAYLAGHLVSAKPLGTKADRFSAFGFACPVCGKEATVATGFSTGAPFVLTCAGGCEIARLREALHRIAPLAFEVRDDVLYSFGPDAERRVLDAVVHGKVAQFLDHDERATLRKFRASGGGDVTPFAYRGPSGAPIMFTFRRRVGERKKFLPAHLEVDASDNADMVFRFPSGLWPIYGWDRLVAEPIAPVLLVEGEGTADAAQELFRDHVVVTSASGSGNVSRTDWSPLHGRDVTIWRDNDAAGSKYERTVAAHIIAARAASVRTVALPAGLPDKWDLADEPPAGMTPDDLRRHLTEAAPVQWDEVKSALAPRGGARHAPPFRLPDGIFARDKRVTEAVEQALGHIDSGCKRGRWMGMLSAVHHALGEAGYRLADAWSQRDAARHGKYIDGEVRRIFDAYDVAQPPTPLPLLAMFRAAMKEARGRTKGEGAPWQPSPEALALAHLAEFEESHRKLTRKDNVVVAFQRRAVDGSYFLREMREKNAESVLRRYKVPNFKGEVTNIFDLWQNHALLPAHEAVFEPVGSVADDEFNMFRGFDVQPAPGGRYTLLREHIDAVMAENGDTGQFLWKVIAYRLQNLSGFVPAGLAFTGKQGAGKSSITQVIRRLLAPHSISLSDPDKFLGKNNAALQDKLFVQAEEMDLGRSMAYHHRLMHFVNGDKLDLENKYLSQFQADNHLFIAITSNERNLVRISADSRRFAIYEVTDRLGGDEAARREWYGQMWAELDDGGYEALAYDLLRVDLTGFSPAVIPKTHLFRELAQDDADRDLQRVWWRETLERGVLAETDGKSTDWSAPLPKDALYGRYRGWCEANAPEARAKVRSKAEWAKELGKMLPGGLPAKRIMVAGKRDQFLALPPYEACCAYFEKVSGQTIDRSPQPAQLRSAI
ncbi:DUF5906 domain-containing protein [Sphingomonas sp.]|uniref:DUF5906 domain-containing protein n=1 Tax=Sphingomonas sp. TaxID=28214 RepID=UPI003B0041CD